MWAGSLLGCLRECPTVPAPRGWDSGTVLGGDRGTASGTAVPLTRSGVTRLPLIFSRPFFEPVHRRFGDPGFVGDVPDGHVIVGQGRDARQIHILDGAHRP